MYINKIIYLKLNFHNISLTPPNSKIFMNILLFQKILILFLLLLVILLYS